jgi:hypothetical protein
VRRIIRLSGYTKSVHKQDLVMRLWRGSRGRAGRIEAAPHRPSWTTATSRRSPRRSSGCAPASPRGLWSFNLSLLPDRLGATGDRHWLTAHLVPRLWLNPRLHVGDASHFQLLLGERFAMRHPEAVAADLRPFLAA